VTWQVTHTEIIDWLGTDPPSNDRDALLAFLPHLVTDRELGAVPVPGNRAPVYERSVPGSDLVVTFLVAHQFETIRIVKIDRLA
jgi:hypothetical protein